MTFLTRLSLGNRLIVGLVTLAIFAFGLLSIFSLKQELLPNIQAPAAVVTARMPGGSPQLVAREVASPIEQAVGAVTGVTEVQSTSVSGSTAITVQWQYGLDSDQVVSDVRSAVDATAPGLPSSVETEVMTGSSADIPVLQLAVASGGGRNAGQLVEDVVVPALEGIDGVRQVTLTGRNTDRLAVTLRPDDLRARDLTAQVVTETIRAQAVVTPAGTSYDGNTELAVEVGSSLGSLRQVKALSLATADGPVPLGSVADVELEAVDSTSLARSDGRPAFSVSVLKDTDADAVEISHAVDDLIPGLEQQLGAGTTFTTVFDQAPLIEQSIHDLAVEGGLGLAFAVVIILLFLFSVRSTLITAISIPLSLLIAMIGLQLGGYSLNIFTLAALTVAIGRVVDDSIVVIENIKRRAGQELLTPGDIIASVREVAGAVTASTLTTVAVFLPVAVVSGVVGELFRPFAVTVAVALAASLLVSMTIVPVLAYWFLRGGHRAEGTQTAPGADEQAVSRLQRGYLPVLRLGLRHPILTLGLAGVVFLGTLGAATLLKTDFLGSVADQSTLQVVQELPAGTRLSTTSRAAEKVEQVLADSPEVDGYLTTIGGGGALSGFGPGAGANTATIIVTLPERVEADAVRPLLEQRLGALTGAGEITVSATNTGATNNDVSVLVSGDNSEVLRPAAEQVEALLGTVAGLTDIRSDQGDQRKVLRVQVDRERAARQGFTQAEVGQAVAGAITGVPVGTVTLEGESRDIVVRTQANDASPSDIANLQLPVSQLQQQQAQERASDRLTDKQQAQADQAQRAADRSMAEQEQQLRDQRQRAVEGLVEARRQLEQLEASPPPAPPAPDPARPGPPVTTDTLTQQQYAQQVQQYNQQLASLTAAVEQAEGGIDQLDEQLEATAEQAAKTAEQRESSEELQDEQQALADVRAKPLRVKDVAKVTPVSTPTTVTQIDGTPTVTLTATPPAGALGEVSDTIQRRLDAASELPPGVTATLGGAAQDQEDAFNQLGLAMLAAIALVFAIMVATFGSLRQPLILLISIPFAATGAIAALLITQTSLGVPSMIGVLMLIGIVVTNAIVLIDLINQYRAAGEDLESAVVDGARLRLRPILMTAAATVFALVPMGLGLTGGGAFISKPLAVVVIGGLVSSTVLTLLLVPVLYLLVERRGERRRRAAALSATPG